MQKLNDNSVFIGEKDSMVYVSSVETLSENYDSIIIKARGRITSKAVDVSQISVHRILKGWKVDKVEIGTELRTNNQNFKQKVSWIEITIKKEIINGD